MQEIRELKGLLNKSSEEMRNVQLELARINGSPEKMPMEDKQAEKPGNKDLELEKIITVLQDEKATTEEEMKRLTEILFLFQEREKEHLSPCHRPPHKTQGPCSGPDFGCVYRSPPVTW